MKEPVRRSFRPLPFCGAILAVAFTAPRPVQASTYQARFTLGSYVSRENFSEALDGQNYNDFFTISSRLYLKTTGLSQGRLGFTADVRDKHDFFDKLDRERKELSSRNSFQLRQLSTDYSHEAGGFYSTFGRFPVPEAGAVNTDGAAVGYRISPSARFSVFGGLNPKRIEQTYLTFNPDSGVYGAYALYQPKAESWGRYLYWSNAVVAQTFGGHTDRLFLFDHFVYQWQPASQLMGLAYVDFAPRTYLQSASLSYLQRLSPDLSSTLGLNSIDVIEYSRRAGLLEVLDPSPYREGSLSIRYQLNPIVTFHGQGTYGIRLADGLSKAEIALGPSFSRFISRRLSAHAQLVARRNFTADEAYLRAGVGYYSSGWEFILDQEVGIERELNGNLFHPRLLELNVSHYLSKALYATFSLQNVGNERVEIVSGFFKLGYRFGTEDIPPVRDGSPPRGKL